MATWINGDVRQGSTVVAVLKNNGGEKFFINSKKKEQNEQKIICMVMKNEDEKNVEPRINFIFVQRKKRRIRLWYGLTLLK